MHLCQQHTAAVMLGGEARLCLASGDLLLGPCAGGKWPSDNGVFKEAKWIESRESLWRSWVAFSMQRNAGGLWYFQAGEQ